MFSYLVLDVLDIAYASHWVLEIDKYFRMKQTTGLNDSGAHMAQINRWIAWQIFLLLSDIQWRIF